MTAVRSHCMHLSAVMLLGASTAASAQDTAAWQVVNDVAGPAVQYPMRLVATPDGGVVSIEVTLDAPTASAVATKFDENGDLAWRVVVPKDMTSTTTYARQAADGAVDASGNVYLLVDTHPAGLLRRLTPSGSEVWTVTVPTQVGGVYYPARLVLDDLGRPIVGGTTVISSALHIELQKFDTNGALVWHEGSYLGELHGLERTPSGDVLAFGRYASLLGPYVSGVVTRHTTDGTPRWRNIVSTSPYIQWDWGSAWFYPVEDLAIDAAGNSYAIVNGYHGIDPWTNPEAFVVQATSPSGTEIFRHELVADAARVRAIAVDALGRVYAAGKAAEAPSSLESLRVWCFDPTGALLWSSGSSATAGHSSRALAVDVDGDGNVLVSGWIEAPVARALEVSFSPNGTERWARLRDGALPALLTLGDFDLTQDVRGNSFTIGSHVEPGSSSTQAAATTLVKHLAGAPIGASTCGPAVPNSSGTPGEVHAVGSTLVASDNVTLQTRAVPPDRLVLFLASRNPGHLPGVGGGQGTLCLGNPIGRYRGPGQVRRTNADGVASLQLHLDRIPQPTGHVQGLPGDTWYFQAWFRDWNPTATSNLTDARAITLQ